ncbi:protein SDA1 homolog isoform X2 [Olea europaea var. sylvestris]|uniref:protein SDA1 homolog isoform X2 n=1 Tax=Olea europaea var. sylvestris TaxID=158386 RepID=UPI000C1D6E8B|nr:protein SDA1 homolog isoform X2 [Olea europaea var. sylvestris]
MVSEGGSRYCSKKTDDICGNEVCPYLQAPKIQSMASSRALIQDFMSASGRASEKLSLPILQSKMKSDPEGYTSELVLIYYQFKSSLELFEQQAALNFTSLSGIATDPTVAKDLGDRALFLAHVTPFYPKQLAQFPKELAQFLKSSALSLPSGLRVHVTEALILLSNRKLVDIVETLELFMELQSLGDRVLRQLAFSNVIHGIRRMNQKHKNDPKNRALQNILFSMLQREDEAIAKRALITLCDFHRRKVWLDDRTANAICVACFHVSSKIMIAALSFLLDSEKIENDDDADDSGSEDDLETQQTQIVVNKESIYKHKGTTSSKKKKKAKLQRVIRSMKKQQRLSSKNSNNSNYFSPLNHLKDAQGFAEKLFSRLPTCNEKFEVKMMMLKVISRTVGLHRLILLNFYPYLQKYIQPHQRDVTSLLAAAVQACHDMVPPDAVEPLFKQIVNQFVHDRSRTEAISVGLNVVREICLRMPLCFPLIRSQLMIEDLLQDLVLSKKSHEKAVSSAARSLVTLFREVCPSLLIKKDRGRPTHPKARPKAFGEVQVASNVPGVELLKQDDDGSGDDIDEDGGYSGLSNDDNENVDVGPIEEGDSQCEYGGSSDDDSVTDGDSGEYDVQEDDEVSDSDNDDKTADHADDISDKYKSDEHDDEELQEDPTSLLESDDGTAKNKKSKAQKRKFSDFDGQLNAASKSLRALKKLAGEKVEDAAENTSDGILSNEDFQRIKELKTKEEAKIAVVQHGFKIPSSDQLGTKRIDAAKLEANIRKKLTKDEKLALVRAGREERGKYQSRTSIKRKKTGGTSNQQKEHKKAMPLAARRFKIAKVRVEKKKKQQRSGKQFRGRKAWK